ncbi:MAG TPA: hypothetical protein VHN11_03235 [Xanthobacteraceae bacterium]|nr:hypothetical protein [Xanthobacteraceae bacterium]
MRWVETRLALDYGTGLAVHGGAGWAIAVRRRFGGRDQEATTHRITTPN